MKRVVDLNAHEAATTSRGIWNNRGERKAALQLLYYALTQDKYCPQALFVLTNGLSTMAGEKVAVVVTEHIYNNVSDEKIKSRIRLARRIDLNLLHLVSHPSGKTTGIPIEEWEHSPDFVVDEEGLSQITSEVLQSHTLEQAFEAACLLVGVQAGLIVPKTPKEEGAPAVDFQECFHPRNFRQADHYSSFLAAVKLYPEF